MGADAFRISQSADRNSATLAVWIDALETHHTQEFGEACDRLLATGRKHLIVDLRRLQNLRSCFIGLIIKLADEAGKSGRRVAAVAAPRVAQLLGMFATEVGLELQAAGAEDK